MHQPFSSPFSWEEQWLALDLEIGQRFAGRAPHTAQAVE